MKKVKHLDIYLITLALIALTAVSLRTVACLTAFNPATLHFADKTAIGISNLLVTLGVVFSATFFFTRQKNLYLVASAENAATYIPAGLVSVALLFIGLERYYAMDSMVFDSILLKYLSYALIGLAGISIPAFFLLIFNSKNESNARAALFLCIVLYLTVYSLYLYFNRSVHPLNSPNKIVDQMAYLFAAMFFLFETRISLGRAIWKPYIIFGLCASLLTAYSAIPSLIVYLVNGSVISDSTNETAVTLALCIFITSRVILTGRLSEDVECPEAEAISTLSDVRKAEMADKKKSLRAHVINNNEENDTVDTENYQFDIPEVAPRAEETEE